MRINGTAQIFLCPILILLACSEARAQESDTGKQFWPEVDIFVKLRPRFRLFFLATVSKNVEDEELFGSNAFDSQFGAHIDFIPNKHVILRTGYRFGSSIGDTEDPNRYAFGCQFPMLRRHAPLKMLFPERDIVLDVYYMRQNDSRSSPRHINAVGLVVNFHF